MKFVNKIYPNFKSTIFLIIFIIGDQEHEKSCVFSNMKIKFTDIKSDEGDYFDEEHLASPSLINEFS